jgi:benzoate membrane transport protein
LGLTGLVKKIMSWLPMPIAMAMVAGVLLQFGLGIITSLREAPLVCGLTLIAFLCVSLIKPLARRFPPVLGAILGGFAATALLTETEWHRLEFNIAEVTVFAPDFTWPATMELVVPLMLTVVAIQNAQGMAILRAMGYEPPFNAVTIVSGAGSILVAPFGSQSVCLAGPMTGIVTNPRVGAMDRRYAAAIVTGILWMLFGLFSPVATAMSRILPGPLIDLLAGLALLEVLASCFAAAFGSNFRFGAILTFLITISGVRLLNVGAPFWGLIGGTVFSLLLDRADFSSRSER